MSKGREEPSTHFSVPLSETMLSQPMKPIRMRVPKKLAVITAQSYSTVEWPQLSSSLYRLLTNPNCAFPADNLYK